MNDDMGRVTITLLPAEVPPEGPLPASITLPPGVTVDCRGRNGWFAAHEFEVRRWLTAEAIELDVWSARRGNCAPILIQMPPDVAEALARTILRAVGTGQVCPADTPRSPATGGDSCAVGSPKSQEGIQKL